MARRKRLTVSPFETKSADLGGEGSPAPLSPGGAIPPVARVAGDSAQAAALEALSDELTRAREGGRMVIELPLDRIDLDHLIRDRIAADPEEMAALTDSLRRSGQRTPIDVVALSGGRYGLISGWRRLTALRALAAEGQGPGHVLALLRQPADGVEAYRAMIEENEVRADLSYYERARIVQRAVEAGVFPEVTTALQGLFAAATRPRRSKIGSFVPIVLALDGVLRFPQAVPERLGLKLSQALKEDPDLAARLTQALRQADPQEAAAERTVLEAALRPTKASPAKAAQRGRVVISRDAQGHLVLDGPGTQEPDFRQRLTVWLKTAGYR